MMERDVDPAMSLRVPSLPERDRIRLYERVLYLIVDGTLIVGTTRLDARVGIHGTRVYARWAREKHSPELDGLTLRVGEKFRVAVLGENCERIVHREMVLRHCAVGVDITSNTRTVARAIFACPARDPH